MGDGVKILSIVFFLGRGWGTQAIHLEVAGDGKEDEFFRTFLLLLLLVLFWWFRWECVCVCVWGGRGEYQDLLAAIFARIRFSLEFFVQVQLIPPLHLWAEKPLINSKLPNICATKSFVLFRIYCMQIN